MSTVHPTSFLDSHRNEIRSLVSGNEIRRASARLMDFAKDYAVDRGPVREAIVLSREIETLRTEVRRLGASEETRRRHRNLLHQLLALLDVVYDQASRPKAAGFLTTKGRTVFEKVKESLRVVRLNEARSRFKKQRNTERGDAENDEIASAYTCTDVSRSYRKHNDFRLHDIDLELQPGEITGIVGANGSGKTTLLRMIAGELLPDAGQYSYPRLQPGATDASPIDWALIRSQIGYLRQRPYRWPGRVADNLYRAAAFRGLLGTENTDEVDFMLQRLGLEQFRDSRWNELSSGFRMRFELAKTLVSKPRLLILDEPLAPLDVDAQHLFLQDVRDVATSDRSPLPVVISSQHLYEIEATADKLVFLSEGEPIYSGSVVDIGANRTTNTFEIEIVEASHELPPRVKSVVCDYKRCMLGRFLIQTPLAVQASDLLSILLSESVKVRYFRDLSKSSRTFFESARGEPNED